MRGIIMKKKQTEDVCLKTRNVDQRLYSNATRDQYYGCLLRWLLMYDFEFVLSKFIPNFSVSDWSHEEKLHKSEIDWEKTTNGAWVLSTTGISEEKKDTGTINNLAVEKKYEITLTVVNVKKNSYQMRINSGAECLFTSDIVVINAQFVQSAKRHLNLI